MSHFFRGSVDVNSLVAATSDAAPGRAGLDVYVLAGDDTAFTRGYNELVDVSGARLRVWRQRDNPNFSTAVIADGPWDVEYESMDEYGGDSPSAASIAVATLSRSWSSGRECMFVNCVAYGTSFAQGDWAPRGNAREQTVRRINNAMAWDAFEPYLPEQPERPPSPFNVLKAIIWHGGRNENSPTADEYASQLQDLLEDLARRVPAIARDSPAIVLCSPSPQAMLQQPLPGPCAALATLSVPHGVYVSSVSPRPIDYSDAYEDHFTPTGAFQFAQRLVEALAPLDAEPAVQNTAHEALPDGVKLSWVCSLETNRVRVEVADIWWVTYTTECFTVIPNERLTAGAAYACTVTPLSLNGAHGVPAKFVFYAHPETEAPTVGGVAVSNAADSTILDVSWERSNAAFVTVEYAQSVDGPWTTHAAFAQSSDRITGLARATDYYVRATPRSGTRSGDAVVVQAQTSDGMQLQVKLSGAAVPSRDATGFAALTPVKSPAAQADASRGWVLDVTNGYLEAACKLPASYSVCAWVKTAATATAARYWAVCLAQDLSNQAKFRLSGTANVAPTKLFAGHYNIDLTQGALDGTLDPATAWLHVCETWDNATGDFTVYINGAAALQNTYPYLTRDPITSTETALAVGRAVNMVTYLDDVRVYDYALSPADLLAVIAQ